MHFSALGEKTKEYKSNLKGIKIKTKILLIFLVIKYSNNNEKKKFLIIFISFCDYSLSFAFIISS